MQYLKERRLSPDEYYDTVVFAFLDCVISGKDNFKKRAYAAMDKAVAAVKAESDGNIISLFCNDDYYRIVAETLADEHDSITELLERIQISELLGAFEQNEREVLALLEVDTPSLGVVRQDAMGWLEEIRRHPKVRLITVTEENRDDLPRQLAEYYRPLLNGKP